MDYKIIAAMFTTLLLSAGLSSLIDNGSTLYSCASKPDVLSDCVNGLKSCTGSICTRCYYDPVNKLKYSTCTTGWSKFSYAEGNSSIINPVVTIGSPIYRVPGSVYQYSCTYKGCKL